MPITRAICWAVALVLCSLLHPSTAISPQSDLDAIGTIHVPRLKPDLAKGVQRVLSPLILEHRTKVTLHVRLVGFKHDGNHALSITENELRSYLHTLPSIVNTTVLSLHEHMMLPAEINYFVSSAPPTLASELERAISLAVRAAHLPTGEEHGNTEASKLRMIPHDLVDAIIQRDLQHTQDNHYTLYILNPKAAPYAYAYSYGGKDTCSGTLWAGNRPYAWVDLTAGPVHYGPGPGQRGQVLDHSLPSLRHLNTAQLRAAAIPELAALAQSAVQHLVWPPLQHSEVHRATSVEVHLVHLHKSLMMHGTKVSGPDLKEQLSRVLLAPSDQLLVKEHYLALDDCDVCTAALTRAMKLRSVRGKGPYLHMVLSEYLDSEELYSWLTRSNDEILAMLHVHQPDNGPLVLPVYIIDQGASAIPVLLDGDKQAVAFPGMAIATHIIHHTVETEFMCNGEEMFGDETTMTQAVLAALLQAGWGVAPTSVAVSAAGIEQHTHLWSVGNDPFTPLARPNGMAFAQADAARRNVILVQLNKTIVEAEHLMTSLDKLVGARPIGDVLTKKQKSRFETDAAGLFGFLEVATHALGVRDYSKAQENAVAAEMTLKGMTELLHDVHYDLATHFVCPHLPLFTGWWVGAVGALLLALALFVVRTRQEASRSKWY